ncbi:MAG: hypothetical protein QNI84_13255 [Henriciella sp.]|nr:hypothetical protein [Henriciella sp.]
MNQTQLADPLTVPCPKCFAPRGEPCRAPRLPVVCRAQHLDTPHDERQTLANTVANRHSLALYEARPKDLDKLRTMILQDGLDPNKARHVIVIVQSKNKTTYRRRCYAAPTGDKWKCYFEKRHGGIHSGVWTVHPDHLVETFEFAFPAEAAA